MGGHLCLEISWGGGRKVAAAQEDQQRLTSSECGSEAPSPRADCQPKSVQPRYEEPTYERDVTHRVWKKEVTWLQEKPGK
jgi:hypothetical protein